MSKFIVFIKNTWRDSEKATWKEIWKTVKRHNWRWRSHDKTNMGDAARPDFIYTTQSCQNWWSRTTIYKIHSKRKWQTEKRSIPFVQPFIEDHNKFYGLCVFEKSLFFQFCLVPPMRQKGHTSLVKLLHLLSFFILKKYSTAIQFVMFEIIDIFFKMKTKSSLVRLVIQC